MFTTLIAMPSPTSVPPEQTPSSSPGGGLGSLLPFLLIIVVVMLFMPLFSKKERHRQKRLQTLKKHDRVVTSGGLYGTVIALEENTVTLEVAKGVRMTFKRSSVFDIEKPGEAKEAADADKAGAKSA